MKNIAILGSTGSIGTQTLEVIQEHLDQFCVEVLTAHSNSQLLIAQSLKFNPNAVVITDESKYAEVKEGLASTDIKVYAGKQALEQIVEMDSIDIVLTALVGAAGLPPTVRAILAKKNIALANKETLVVAGEIITQLAKENGVNIYPVDSEHSAIFQCLAGEWHNPIEKIVLTASGGPFRQKPAEELAEVTKAQALKHPNWTMGAKITIDSATLMNKGLEMIEARWLFNLAPSQIKVVVHAQSIIHSMVQFEDGSIKAQMGLPDMKLPIQYAMAFPQRLKNNFPRYTFDKPNQLSFDEPDMKTFRNLYLAKEAMEKGGNTPCVLNAANEIAVYAFLRNRIGFLEMTELIEKTLEKINYISKPSLEDYFETDGEARNFAASLIQL